MMINILIILETFVCDGGGKTLVWNLGLVEAETRGVL